MENLKQRNIEFFDKVSGHYEKGLFGKWTFDLQRRVVEEIGVKKGMKILDVGCGTGNFLKLLADKNKDLKLYGIDVSTKMLEIAKGKLGGKVILENVSAEDIEFKNESFDYVVSVEAFHHFVDKDKAMENFYRVLKKGGKLIIVDLNFGVVLNWVFNKVEPGNTGMTSRGRFKELFKERGFGDVVQKKIGSVNLMTGGVKNLNKFGGKK